MSQIPLHYYNADQYFPAGKCFVWMKNGLTAIADYDQEQDKFYSLDGSELKEIVFFAEIPTLRVLMKNYGR